MGEIKAKDNLQICEYFHERFLKQEDRFYIDIQEQIDKLTISNLIGVVSHKFDLTFHEAQQFVNHEKSKLRAWCGRKVFLPNQKSVHCKNGLYYINEWRPSEFEPRYNSKYANLFTDFLTQCTGSKEKAHFIIAFLAHRFQNPLKKCPHALYLYGSQGQGKTIFTEIINKVFGKANVRKVGKTEDVYSKGSVKNWSRIFLIAEEIKVQRGSAFYSELKSFTGMDTVEADEKHKAFTTYKIPAQLIMISNEAPTFIEKDDRRFFISKWETKLEKKEKDQFFKGFVEKLDNAGYEHIAWYLQHYSLVNYEPFSKPLLTKEKEQMILTSINCVTLEVIDTIKDSPNQYVWSDSDFEDIWKKHNSTSNQKKHILLEAKLQKIQRVKVHNQQRSDLWMNQGCEFIKGSGSNEPVITDQQKNKKTLSQCMSAQDTLNNSL